MEWFKGAKPFEGEFTWEVNVVITIDLTTKERTVTFTAKQ